MGGWVGRESVQCGEEGLGRAVLKSASSASKSMRQKVLTISQVGGYSAWTMTIGARYVGLTRSQDGLEAVLALLALRVVAVL